MSEEKIGLVRNDSIEYRESVADIEKQIEELAKKKLSRDDAAQQILSISEKVEDLRGNNKMTDQDYLYLIGKLHITYKKIDDDGSIWSSNASGGDGLRLRLLDIRIFHQSLFGYNIFQRFRNFTRVHIPVNSFFGFNLCCCSFSCLPLYMVFEKNN